MLVQFFTALQLMVTEKFDRRSDEGATMVEYGLLVALIAVVVAVAAAVLGTKIASLFTNVTATL